MTQSGTGVHAFTVYVKKNNSNWQLYDICTNYTGIQGILDRISSEVMMHQVVNVLVVGVASAEIFEFKKVIPQPAPQLNVTGTVNTAPAGAKQVANTEIKK